MKSKTSTIVSSACGFLIMSGCASTGDPATVTTLGDSSLKKVVESKGYSTIPRPRDGIKPGQLYYLMKQGGQIALIEVGECQGVFDSMPRSKPFSEPWGKVNQIVNNSIGFEVGYDPAGLSANSNVAVDSATASAEYDRYSSYVVNFGDITVEQMAVTQYSNFKGILTKECAVYLDRVSAAGGLGSHVFIAAVANSNALSWTYNLNPQTKAKVKAEDPTASEAETTVYDAKCGAHGDLDFKLLKTLSVKIDGKHCVRGDQTLVASRPYAVGVISYSAKDLRKSGNMSGGTAGRVELTPNEPVSLDSIEAMDNQGTS